MGIRLVYEDGDICEVTKMPRRTSIKIPCNQGAVYSQQNWTPQRAWEGKGKEICHYFIEFPASKFGCPTELRGSAATDQSNQLHVDTVTTFSHARQEVIRELPVPEIMAVTGCVDSDPARTTRECHFAGKINLVLHGVNFYTLCDTATPSPSISAACISDFSRRYSVVVGEAECGNIALVSQYQINCTVEKATGLDQDVMLKKRCLFDTSKADADGVGDGVEPTGTRKEEFSDQVVVSIRGAVSFKEKINYRERFDKFVEMGVGGMKEEIDELYRRAFASRGQSATVV